MERMAGKTNKNHLISNLTFELFIENVIIFQKTAVKSFHNIKHYFLKYGTETKPTVWWQKKTKTQSY